MNNRRQNEPASPVDLELGERQLFSTAQPNPKSKIQNPKWKWVLYIFIGTLTLAVLLLSFVQLWVLYSMPEISGFGSVPVDERGLPAADQRGAFLVLKEAHDPLYPTDLIQLLATSAPGVVDTAEGAHVRAQELSSVLVQSAALSEQRDYRVYLIAVPDSEQEAMKTTKPPGGKILYIEPEDGTWEPGSYQVDIPAEGMFGGRTYFQFYVEE